MDTKGKSALIRIHSIRHAFPEAAGFFIDRPRGHKKYTFLHFFESVTLRVGEQEYVTRPHACIIYAPHTPQYFYSSGPLVHDWFHFEGEPPRGVIRPDCIYYPSGGAFITDIVQEMETEFSARRAHSDQLLDLKARELFIKLSRGSAGDDRETFDKKTEDSFFALRSAMFSNLSEDWTSERMAKQVNLSRSRFFMLYKTFYGVSPTEDLINARIQSAKNLLLFTDRPIAEIADAVGYRNITHFMRQFRERTGKTPKGYRLSGRG